jgi:hypothetical protein
MVLTKCGCLLVFCSVLAVCLFCWLSYASLSSTGTRRSGKSQGGADGVARGSHTQTESAAISG